MDILLSRQYVFKTFKDYLDSPDENSIVLRHDVERLPQNSLIFAKIQSSLNIKGTYYFRVLSKSYNIRIIKEIASLGHEIGYHYETMATCKGNTDIAYDQFCRNLDKFRKLVPVSTICMHGSPLSRYDNIKIWEKYDYRKLGIIGEPYMDIDYNKVLYLTDTGRMWNGEKYSVRDKVAMERRKDGEKGSQKKFHSTVDIIQAAENGTLPQKIMFTFHPQRWTDKPMPWIKELVWQNLKNQVKGTLGRGRDRERGREREGEMREER